MAQKLLEPVQHQPTRVSAGFLDRFAVMRGAIPELWVVFIVKLLAIVAYSLMNKTFVLWLSSDFGFGDARAGLVVAAWSMAVTFFTVLVGSLTDAIGLRRAFLLGVLVCIAARAVMTFTTLKWLALGAGMLPLAFGEALGVPVMVAAIRRYSTTAQRSMSFSFFYALMNVGFFIAAYVADHVRKSLGEPHGHWIAPLLGVNLTTYRTIFLISFLVELLIWPVIYFGLRPGVEATDEGLKITPEAGPRRGSGLDALGRTICDALAETARIFTGLWRQPGFYKFLAFLSLAAFVRLIFVQMDYTYPKFGIRELGPGAPILKLFAINSILIIFLVPIVGALSQRISAYRMVMWGSAVAAGSVFVMTLPPAWFAGVAGAAPVRWVAWWYLGLSGEVNPWYVMIFIYVVILSVGEACYSPRLYEYAAVVAPKGQEASYMALSVLPFFLAKCLVAAPSGLLLTWFCPEQGPRHPAMLWLIIALTTSIAPVGMIFLRRWIRVPESGRED